MSVEGNYPNQQNDLLFGAEFFVGEDRPPVTTPLETSAVNEANTRRTISLEMFQAQTVGRLIKYAFVSLDFEEKTGVVPKEIERVLQSHDLLLNDLRHRSDRKNIELNREVAKATRSEKPNPIIQQITSDIGWIAARIAGSLSTTKR